MSFCEGTLVLVLVVSKGNPNGVSHKRHPYNVRRSPIVPNGHVSEKRGVSPFVDAFKGQMYETLAYSQLHNADLWTL